MALFLADDDGIPWVAILSLGVIAAIFVAAVVAAAVPASRDPRRCLHCGTVAKPKAKYQGSTGVSVVLLLFFFPGFIAYEIWRAIALKWICPTCERAGMIPLAAPTQAPAPTPALTRYTGIQVLAMPEDLGTRSPPPLIVNGGRFRISGVDRDTRMDTVWHCAADSEANARVKAELEGIVVTAVERE